MSDIFLSYATDDMMTAAKLAAVFQRQGLGVWWDVSTITPGANYLEAVVEELEHSKVIVMLWSHASSESRLVREVLNRRPVPIVVVLLEEAAKVDMPMWLLFVKTFDFSDWDRSASHAKLQRLVAHLSALLDISLPPVATPASFEELSLSDIRENARLGINEGANSQPEAAARFKGVFISYRRNEAAAYAGRLYDRLAARFGKERIFIDMENVGVGDDFVDAITAAAESCAVMVVLISRQWSRGENTQTGHSDYVRLEVAKALGRGIRVIPILIQGASMPAPKELPEDLAPLVRRNALALSDTRWERDVEDLIKSLENLL